MIGFYINTHHPVSATTEQKLCCENQTHAFHLPGVYQAALGGVDTGGVDAGMA